MMTTVCENHDLNITERYIHTDSKVVLSWIRSPPREFKQYVAYRVGEIRTLTDLKEWRYIPSKENPADSLTKWNRDTEIHAQGRWINGPAFLYRPKECWPEQNIIAHTSEERRVSLLAHSTATSESPLIDASRFSKWKVLVRTVATIRRFITNCRLKQIGKAIKTLEATKK